jgi:hypothetical protein
MLLAARLLASRVNSAPWNSVFGASTCVHPRGHRRLLSLRFAVLRLIRTFTNLGYFKARKFVAFATEVKVNCDSVSYVLINISACSDYHLLSLRQILRQWKIVFHFPPVPTI